MDIEVLNNLRTIWEQLDDACGALDNAFTNIHSIDNVPQEVKDTINQIDFSSIVSLKNSVEEMIENEQEVDTIE